MDKFTDFLVYLIPIVIFIASSVFGGQKKKLQQPQRKPASQQDADINTWFDLIAGGEENENHIPEPAAASEKPSEEPVHAFESAENAETVPEEGVQAITVEQHDDDLENSTAGIPDFDARAAIIYSSIIERKYC